MRSATHCRASTERGASRPGTASCSRRAKT
jgi:hypothetical protein